MRCVSALCKFLLSDVTLVCIQRLLPFSGAGLYLSHNSRTLPCWDALSFIPHCGSRMCRQRGNPQGEVNPFEPVGGPGAWVTADYKENEAWIYRLTVEDVQELEDAVQSVIDSGVRIQVPAMTHMCDAGQSRVLHVVRRANSMIMCDAMYLCWHHPSVC